MKDKKLRRIMVFFLLISIVLIVVAVQAVRNISHSTVTSDWVNHTHTVVMQIDALSNTLYVADASVANYVTTGDVHNLSESNRAISKIREHMEILNALSRHEPDRHQQVLKIEILVNQRLENSQAILAARQEGQVELSQSLLAKDAGGTVVPEIQRMLNSLKDIHLDLLTKRDTASYLQAQKTRWTVWAGVVLNVFLIGGVVLLIRDDLAARRKVTETLQQANDQLETKVQERTAELAATNQQLTAENRERQWTNQALEHQLRYNHHIVDSISDLVFVLTRAANISRVNPAVLHLTGWETTDLINKPLAHVVQLPDSDSPGANPVTQAMKEGRDLPAQFAVIIDRHGKQTPVRLSLFPLRDHDKVIGGTLTLQIISNG